MSTIPHPAPPADIVDRLRDDTLTLNDRWALARVVYAVQAAEGLAERSQSPIPGEWAHVVGVVAELG